MSTRHLVDRELLPALELLPAFDLSTDKLPMVRQSISDSLKDRPRPALEGVKKRAESPAGPLDIYWFDPMPGEKDRPALLYIHGGGMVLGSAHEMSASPAAFATGLGIKVASVEYRLAPETAFPGPQEDCYAALVWLRENCDELGVGKDRIAVCGESAGGGLAAAVAQIARDSGGPNIAAQFLIYPMLDHRTGSSNCPYVNDSSGEFVWNRVSNQFGWESLRGDYTPDDHRKGWFSPSLAANLSDLPPAWIGVGGLDLFLDEDIDYARRLANAGVSVEFHCYRGAFHGFTNVPNAGVAKACLRDLHEAIKRQLAIEN